MNNVNENKNVDDDCGHDRGIFFATHCGRSMIPIEI